MKKFICFSFSIMFSAFSVQAQDTGLSPSSLKLAVYKFAVSTSGDCTNLTTVIDNGNTPVDVEFVGGVNIGAGTIAPGTYPCVVVEFSDNIKFTSATNSTSTNCSTAVENTVDVCRGGMGSTSVLIDGTTTTCTNAANRVAMYLSTASVGGNSDAFNRPLTSGVGSDANFGFNLAAALSVTGSASGKFVVNPAGKVCDNNSAACDGGPGGTGVGTGACMMEPPSFSFTQL